MPEEHHYGEDRSHADPSDAPEHGLSHLYHMAATMEDPKVEGQHDDHKQVEKNPEERLGQSGLTVLLNYLKC